MSNFNESETCLSGIKSSVYKERKQRGRKMEAEAGELLIDSADIEVSNTTGGNMIWILFCL